MSALEIALQDAGFLEQARTICNAQGVTLLEVLTHLFAASTSVAAVNSHIAFDDVSSTWNRLMRDEDYFNKSMQLTLAECPIEDLTPEEARELCRD